MPRPVGRRVEIHETFIRHVAERGYEATNLGDIANELGMSKGTIVHHFGTKAQMLRELEESYMQRQLDTIRRLWDRLEKPHERLASVIYAAALLQVLDRDATVATQREVVQLAADPAMQVVRKLRAEAEGLVRNEIVRGGEQGIFRAVDPRLATVQLWGSLQWMWVWFDPKGSLTPEVVGASFADIFLGGLMSSRRDLKRLTDPEGEVPRLVREAYDVVISDASAV